VPVVTVRDDRIMTPLPAIVATATVAMETALTIVASTLVGLAGLGTVSSR
jgi:hypothetical protein